MSTHHVSGAILGAALLLLPTFAGAATDRTTSLPLYAGASAVPNPMPQMQSCGHTETLSIYVVKNVPLATVVGWYRKQLRGVAPKTRTITSPVDDDTTETENLFYLNGGSATVLVGAKTYRGTNPLLKADATNKVLLGYAKYAPPIPLNDLMHCSKP